MKYSIMCVSWWYWKLFVKNIMFLGWWLRCQLTSFFWHIHKETFMKYHCSGNFATTRTLTILRHSTHCAVYPFSKFCRVFRNCVHSSKKTKHIYNLLHFNAKRLKMQNRLSAGVSRSWKTEFPIQRFRLDFISDQLRVAIKLYIIKAIWCPLTKTGKEKKYGQINIYIQERSEPTFLSRLLLKNRR